MWKNIIKFGPLLIFGLGLAAWWSAGLTGETAETEAEQMVRVLNVPDHNGNNLFVQGTPGYDFIKIYEDKGDLCVSVAGVHTNVTKETRLKAIDFYSIGIVGLGNDDVDINGLGRLPGGILKDNKVLVAGSDAESDSNRKWNAPFNKRPGTSDFGEISLEGDEI